LETSQNPANMFTKSLSRLKFEFYKDEVGIHLITLLKHELIKISTKKVVHLELGRQWKVIVFQMYFVKKKGSHF
jgi:hypothetical protein